MLQIGNQTSCWTATPTEPFEYALSQRFDAFEWFPDKKPGVGWDESDLDSNTRRTIRERARASGMRLSVHARWQANLLTTEGRALITRDIELARDLEAGLLNIHFEHERGVDAFIEAILPVIEQTAKTGLQLAIENTPLHAPEQFNALFFRLRSRSGLEAAHVGMCLDLGHANLCAATRNDYLNFHDRLSPDLPIIHTHLHENWGDSDSHLPLFTGPAARDDAGIRGLIERLKKRGFSGSAILEQWPTPPSLLNQARDKLLTLWNSNPPGLQPPMPAVKESPAQPPASLKGFNARLVNADRGSRSWREKLDSVLDLLGDEAHVLTADELVAVAVYLRFLGTGEIACVEDGRHFRPASHAKLAARIQERLAALTNSETEFIVRRIYPWLPSSSPTFRRPEPLTRIRDIAHRNDIDPELKREIKTTLQNKLHRCAGPEDLVSASALLDRITAPGADYSPGFVEQFKIFYEELKEFFNAQTLERRLEALKQTANPETQRAIEGFVKRKATGSESKELATLEALTSLRERLLRLAGERPGSEGQEFLLADIALEDYAFVWLSEFINRCESHNGDTALASEIKALTLAIRNLYLSGIERDESAALESELRHWGVPGTPPLRDDLLRVKASALRGRRLAETFGDTIFSLFSKQAQMLGPILGVAAHAVRVFSESDLRSHVIFQVAKLVSGVLGRLRLLLKSPAWDVLVAGRAFGRVQVLDALDQLKDSGGEPLVLVLAHAAGDEEIPSNVTAMILAHEMPHLSHLGVRTRQAGVVFVTCEEAAETDRLRKAHGQMVSVVARPDSVSWQKTGRDEKGPLVAAKRPAPHVSSVKMDPEAAWLPLERATIENSGGKAAGARRLAEISGRGKVGFRTPASLVIPFGVMEAALGQVPGLEQAFREGTTELNGAASADLASGARRMRELLQKIPVPDVIVSQVGRRFRPGAALVVRSSANYEDIEGWAGAGMYDSVANVVPENVGEAISHVWGSLWTERAAAGRLQAGIPHETAHMAVLVQELCDAELAFVLHTVNPVTQEAREVSAEIVVGLGETLVSGAGRATPYRLTCSKDSSRVVTEAFANFSRAAKPGNQGGIRWETLDYSRVDLSRETAARENLGRRLGAIGAEVERALGRAQDIEGVVQGGDIFLVQARPQQGLSG